MKFTASLLSLLLLAIACNGQAHSEDETVFPGEQELLVDPVSIEPTIPGDLVESVEPILQVDSVSFTEPVLLLDPVSPSLEPVVIMDQVQSFESGSPSVEPELLVEPVLFVEPIDPVMPASCEQKDDCFSRYVCGCDPLYCGAWDLQIQGGVNPILWRNRQPIYGVSCTVSAAVPVLTLFNELPKFSKFFKIPWIVGGQLGYHLSDNKRAYVEFNYSQAIGRINPIINTDYTGAIPYTFNFTKYKIFEAYVGGRYYSMRHNSLAFFLGAKVGLTHRKKLYTSLSFTAAPATPIITMTEVYSNNTVLSGGANVGFDICFCGNWSVVVTGEVVACAGPTSVIFTVPTGTITIPPGLTSLIFGTCSELRFPVTAALRYSF